MGCSGRIETRRRHLARQRHANRVADALAQRTRGAFDAWRLTIFRMARRDAVQRTEFL
jgi:hypothetical protein